MPPPEWAALMLVIVIEEHEAPPQATQLCRCIVLTDSASSFSVLVADSLHREELGAMGKVSKVAVGTGKDNPPVLALELTTRGIADEMESDAATVTVMGKVDALIWGTLPNCKKQVRACKALPTTS